MKMSTLVVLFISMSMVSVTAQSVRYHIAQPCISLSAYSLKQNDPLSFTGNQAALAQINNAGIGIFGERRFMLKEISAYTLTASMPSRLGNFGLQLNYAGFKNFNENKIGLAFARHLGRLVDVGVQFNYYGYRTPAYGNATAINFEIGILMQVTNNMRIGVHVYNPVGGKIGKDKAEKLAAVYKLGWGYEASERFFISSEIIKEEDKAVNIIAGLQYQFAKQFFAKAGCISESGTVYGGVGAGWKNLRLDMSSSYHPQLGFSPGLLLIIQFKRGKA